METSIEEIQTLVQNKDKIVLVSTISRPGMHAFLVDLEYHHFLPDSPKNDLFEMFVLMWEGLQWVVVAFPKEEEQTAKDVAKKYFLKFSDGTPTCFSADRVTRFPIEGENVFTLESFEGKRLSKKEEETITASIFAEFEKNKEKLIGVNFGSPTIVVEHSSLRKIPSDDSVFHRFCPSCTHGVLLARRDNKTFELQAEDFCILCGQSFVYSDIDELKKLG